LQCAARPEGTFWSSDDWKEFRKSVTDGSFRYCQKLQCPNIVAGWLPRKKDCKEEWLHEIFNGNYDVIPPIEEFHFSYDEHCNLMCPSCRTERKTNTKEKNEKLDELYNKNLSIYLKHAKHLTLSGCGEAIISPHSKNVLKSFSKTENPDLVVELRTNATSINANSWSALGEGRKVIRHITASIDAADKESFEKLRYPAKWEIVLNNLEFIRRLRNNGEIDMFEFHVVVQTENVNHLCDIVKMAISYDADTVTFSRLINWRGMTEEEYYAVNPFWPDHPMHQELLDEIEKLKELRKQISEGNTPSKKKMYINIHFIPDPDSSYDEIRTGRYKIR
jgi:MoaA/NifB/PqqE/SkfB family radical SAM enzyme